MYTTSVDYNITSSGARAMRGFGATMCLLRRGSALRTGTSALIRYKRNELEYPKDIIQSEGKAQQNSRMVYRVFCVDRVSRSQCPNTRFSLFVHNPFIGSL